MLKTLIKRFIRFCEYVSKIGFKNSCLYALSKVSYVPPVDIFDVDANLAVQTIKIPNVGKKFSIVWYVPCWTNVWGGGHLTIFRFAHLISKLGHKNIIYSYNRHRPAQELKRDLDLALPGNNLVVLTTGDRFPDDHIAVASTWQSTYEVLKHSSRAQKFYFMQDYESYFYPFGTQSLQANASYELGFYGITGGTWLKKKFESHGGVADNYIFSVDKEIFYPKSDLGSEIRRLFFYGRASTPRRAYELGIASLEAIHNRLPNVEILIAGMEAQQEYKFPAKTLGNLTLKETGDLYRTCDVGIALSATNLSYLPVELMACGVPVITNSGPNVEWFCKHMNNSLICKPFPSHIADAVEKLNKSPSLRKRLANGGIDKISETSWENEAKKILGFIYKRLRAK